LSHKEWGRRIHAGAAEPPARPPREALARRFLAGVLAMSLMLVTVLTAIEFSLEYRHDRAQVAAGLDAVQRQAGGRLDQALRSGSPSVIQHALADLLQQPSVFYVELVTRDGKRYEAGQPVQPWRDREQRIIKLESKVPTGGSRLLGTVHVESSTSAIKSRLFARFLLRLLLVVLAGIIISVFILHQFDRLVTRHLGAIAAQMQRSNALNLRAPLLLDRLPADDEINQLQNAFSQLRRNLLHEIEIHEASDRTLAAENRLNLLAMNALPQALLRVMPDGRVGWLNARAEALCGQALAEAQGRLLWQLLPAVPGNAGQAAEALFLRARALPGAHSSRLALAGSNGVCECEVQAIALRDGEGQVAGVLLWLEEVRQDESASLPA
jgi:PAS domain-containing protein